jgi:hypothetical protein
MSEQCEVCGKFVSYNADSYVPYGCPDPEYPEPYEPRFYCTKCSEKQYQWYLKRFKEGSRYGDWQKSNAEIRAAKECHLAWVGSDGVGIMIGTPEEKEGKHADSHQYIDQKEYDRLKKYPYWGYCRHCGAEIKGGSCSKSCKK